MIPKRLDDVTIADIEALAANAVPEGRTLEYKAQLPSQKDEEKREFLYDVTSFANTDGGDLIFGVEEMAGTPKAVRGAKLTDTLDATLLRLESLLSTCIEPRIAGVRFRSIDVADGVAVIVVRIPASFAAPHRAGIGATRRFYHRNSRGKAEMDVHELRTAFGASEGLQPRLVGLHQDAVRLVADADLPFALAEGARAVLSVIPLSVVRDPQEIDLDGTTAVWPPFGNPNDWLPALEGLYVFAFPSDRRVTAFTLTRRTGQVDFSWRIGQEDGGKRIISPMAVEEGIARLGIGASSQLSAFGIEGPFAVGLTLLGMKGFKFDREFFAAGESMPAWRDRISLPLVTVESLTREALVPVARSFWYAMGEVRPAHRPLGEADPGRN